MAGRTGWSGRPPGCRWPARRAPAVIWCWYTGSSPTCAGVPSAMSWSSSFTDLGVELVILLGALLADSRTPGPCR